MARAKNASSAESRAGASTNRSDRLAELMQPGVNTADDAEALLLIQEGFAQWRREDPSPRDWLDKPFAELERGLNRTFDEYAETIEGINQAALARANARWNDAEQRAWDANRALYAQDKAHRDAAFKTEQDDFDKKIRRCKILIAACCVAAVPCIILLAIIP